MQNQRYFSLGMRLVLGSSLLGLAACSTPKNDSKMIISPKVYLNVSF